MSAGAVKEGRHICRAFHKKKTKKQKKTMGVKCEPEFGFFSSFFFLHKECVKAWLWASDNCLT